jgi:hypothetical protein
MGTELFGIIIKKGDVWFTYNQENIGLPEDHITAIAHESSSVKWIGTFNHGVVRLEENSVSINTILNSTTTVGQVARTTEFGTRKAGDLGVQALILNIVNLGKFLHYYGNVDTNGVKGSGSGTNSCFLNYNDPRAQALTGASTGACTVDNDGSLDLDQSTAAGKRRICEGAMLLTNTIDILDNLDLSNSSTLSKLEDVSAQVNTYKTAATAAGLGAIINMTSQSDCETYLQTPGQLLDMEFFYALVFDTGLQ